MLVTVTLSAFESTRIIPLLLTITPLVWQRGFLWQLVTYPFVETGGPSLWFVLTLDARGVGLEVRAPDDALPIVHALFGAP